jgi:cytochrome d ubiquinol oxidase subunit II
MATAWFCLLAFMLTMYVVLDGFDLGAGILHLFIKDRGSALAAIGPVWNGNEVWLIASGGLLVFAFPTVYATAFSGIYLPLMMVLWLLVLRGLAIELRSHHGNALWQQFFDVVFGIASTLLALIFGVALGNVLRGVPLDQSGTFELSLFSATPGEAGAINWYTASVGVFAVAALGAHGAMFLRWKTTNDVRSTAFRLWIITAALAIAVTIETAFVRPQLLEHLAGRPGLWVLPLIVIAGFLGVFFSLARGRELPGFIASSVVIAGLLVLTAGALYPLILPSTVDARYSLDITASNDHGALAIGLAWWIPAIALAIGYFVYLYRSFRGKASEGDYHVPTSDTPAS